MAVRTAQSFDGRILTQSVGKQYQIFSGRTGVGYVDGITGVQPLCDGRTEGWEVDGSVGELVVQHGGGLWRVGVEQWIPMEGGGRGGGCGLN